MINGLSRNELQAKSGGLLSYADDCGILSAPEL
jgi:hypothetical protein